MRFWPQGRAFAAHDLEKTMTIFKRAAGAALALTLTTTAAFAQEITLRFQHFLPPSSSVPAFFMAPWAEKVMAESNGRLKIEIYPGMQLGGKPPALYDQIRDGVIDGGWALPAYTPGRFPEVEPFELPFMTSKNAEDTSRAAWIYGETYLTERMGDVKLLALHTHGPGVIHKKGPAVKSLDDLKGLKLRGPSRQANELLQSLGATPVGMPVPSFPEAMSKGVVQGGVIPQEIVPLLKIQELADSHTEVGGDRSLYNILFVWAMNKDSYNALPDDLKAVIDANSGVEASAWAGRAMDKGDDIGVELIKATDNEMHVIEGDMVDTLQALGETQTQAWIEEVTAKGLDGQGMVDLARKLVAEYDK